MHKQECDGESPVTAWVEGNRWTSHTPVTKVQVMMIIHVGDSCLQVWELDGSYT